MTLGYEKYDLLVHGAAGRACLTERVAEALGSIRDRFGICVDDYDQCRGCARRPLAICGDKTCITGANPLLPGASSTGKLLEINVVLTKPAAVEIATNKFLVP